MTHLQGRGGHLLKALSTSIILNFWLHCSTIQGKHVKPMIDNTTAVAVINNMGTCNSRYCHSVGGQIWQFCVNNNICLTAAHIPGSQNVLANSESHHFQNQDKQWKLNSLSLCNAMTL